MDTYQGADLMVNNVNNFIVNVNVKLIIFISVQLFLNSGARPDSGRLTGVEAFRRRSIPQAGVARVPARPSDCVR